MIFELQRRDLRRGNARWGWKGDSGSRYMFEGEFLPPRVLGCARLLGTWLMTCSLPHRAVGPGVGKMVAGDDSERWKMGAGKLLRP